MRSLYITDLDGTLFNMEKKVTALTCDIINKFIAQDGLFTIATARMAYGCDEKLKDIQLNIPGIVMNGVCLYSFSDQQYLDVRPMESTKAKQITKLIDKYACNAFMYTYKDNALSIYYKISDKQVDCSQYLSKRAFEACENIVEIEKFEQATEDDIVYFAFTGHEESINKMKSRINSSLQVESATYLNIYNGLYCFEVFDDSANKANALIRLKDRMMADEVIVFGDNHNDIGMMRVADKSYAVENAVEQAKMAADEIIGSCDEDGVAKFFMKKYKISYKNGRGDL